MPGSVTQDGIRQQKTPPKGGVFCGSVGLKRNSAVEHGALGDGALGLQTVQIPAEVLISSPGEDILGSQADILIDLVIESPDGLIRQRPAASIGGGNTLINPIRGIFDVCNVQVAVAGSNSSAHIRNPR